MVRCPLALLSTLALTVGMTACGGTVTSSDGRLDVVVPAYPFQWVAERVGGDQVTVTNLVKPGAEPHDIELSAQQTAQVTDADLVIHLPGFQPAVDQAVSQHAKDHGFDITSVTPLTGLATRESHAEPDGHSDPVATGSAGKEPAGQDLAGKDPHVWLDPTKLATIADALAERLAQIDPAHADGYRDRAMALRGELGALDAEYTAGLRGCQRTEIVTAHESFGYLADRYKLQQIGISGLSPHDEPSAQRIAQIIAEATAHHATVIFTEAQVSPKVAQAIAQGAGAKTAVLDPIESGPERSGSEGSADDYMKIMRTNLHQLRTALGCP